MAPRRQRVALPDGFGEADARHFVASTIALVTALAPVIAGGTAVAGAMIQSGAQKSAAKEQAKSTAAALGYEKERDVYARGTEANRYGTMMGQNAPFVASGHAANTQMASLLGLPAGPPAAGSAPPGGVGGNAAAGAQVQMRAPDGSVKFIPADQEAHYTQRGAQRVG
jgi:hypothetical protein